MNEPKSEKIVTAKGIVTEALPSTLFKVKIHARPHDGLGASGEDKDGEKEILAYLGGKMRMHRIKVLIGDSVEVVLDSYGGGGGKNKKL